MCLGSVRASLELMGWRIFVLGIGFFTLCFLMTSLGGQFSAKRPGDSPFTIRTEVMGALESRGVLRRMSDMLEMLMKRMDILARLENSTDFHKGDEARFPLDRALEHLSILIWFVTPRPAKMVLKET